MLNIFIILASVFMFFCKPAFAEPVYEFHGESLNRYENWNWFEPATNPVAQNNEYSYFFTRNRLNFKLTQGSISAFVQGQYTQFLNLPGNASGAAPVGAMGAGALYFQHAGVRDSHKIFLKSAYLDIANILNSGVSLRAGRFDYQDGLETLTKDAKIDWLKKVRVGERLLGPFGWSAYTRSFDGAQLKYDNNYFNVTTLVSHPTQGGFEESAGETMENIGLLGVALTLKPQVLIPNTDKRLFYILYDDERNVSQRVDNSGTATAPKVDLEIHTFGAHLASAFNVGDDQIDTLLWGAYQTGDWYNLDHKAFAFDVEGGYQFKKLPWAPHIRLGYFIGSGDSNTSDGDHETFYQMLPTARIYSYTTLYNLMNIEELFLQVFGKPTKKLTFRADWHILRLAEKNDRWYVGAGPTQEKGSIFGYAARTSNSEDELGQSLELTLGYTFNDIISSSLFYGHFFGGDVIEKIYTSDDNFDLAYLETILKF